MDRRPIRLPRLLARGLRPPLHETYNKRVHKSQALVAGDKPKRQAAIMMKQRTILLTTTRSRGGRRRDDAKVNAMFRRRNLKAAAKPKAAQTKGQKK
jgi:hypothetical protein